MPASLSLDLRHRIISAYQAQEGSQRELAKRFKVSFSFVRDLTRRHCETGKIDPKPYGGGRVAKLGAPELSIIKTLVDAQPDVLLEELGERLAEKTKIKVSVSTLHRALQRLGLSFKKTLIASEQETQRVKDLRFNHSAGSPALYPLRMSVGMKARALRSPVPVSSAVLGLGL